MNAMEYDLSVDILLVRKRRKKQAKLAGHRTNQIVRHKHTPTHKSFFYSACDLVFSPFTTAVSMLSFFPFFLLQANISFNKTKQKDENTTQSKTDANVLGDSETPPLQPLEISPKRMDHLLKRRHHGFSPCKKT
jgi:hypothetical protein